eukprot:GAFH01001802.1.p1 GENE.GAFH01001802.1~~GAFH01001802.1.p1  ORF type:complete len:292 (-),score=55.21 GAFH01001802.1:52-927(-)
MAIAVVSSFLLACTITLLSRFSQYNTDCTYVLQGLITAPLSVAASPLLGEDWRPYGTAGFWGWFLFGVYVVFLFLCNGTQMMAVRHIGSANVSTMLPSRLVFTVIGAWMILGEAVTSWVQYLGICIVMGALGAYLYVQARDSKRAAAAAAGGVPVDAIPLSSVNVPVDLSPPGNAALTPGMSPPVVEGVAMPPAVATGVAMPPMLTSPGYQSVCVPEYDQKGEYQSPAVMEAGVVSTGPSPVMPVYQSPLVEQTGAPTAPPPPSLFAVPNVPVEVAGTGAPTAPGGYQPMR